MNPDLDKLVQLQQAEAELRKVESGLTDLPHRREEVETGLADERRRLDLARESLDASVKARRRLESEVQDLEGKRSKYKGQLMEVKTNKEYTAMLHEIEAVEREIRGREDLILGEMEKAETLAAEVKREEEVFRGQEVAARQQLRELEEQGKSLQQQSARLTADRDAVAATLKPDLAARFYRVAKLRGTGVSEARDGWCLQCHMKLRPQMFVDIKKNEEILECPQCSRILYYVPVADPVQQ
jgi:predicted  nucleic acid-binding Zn-ribbon protein